MSDNGSSNMDDFFKIKTNNVLPEKGKLLIADPFASDFYFTRSVVLLSEYRKEEGAMGFILNKPMDSKNYPSEIFETFGEKNLPHVYYGGPVGTTQMFYIHQLPPDVLDGSMEILPNLYWGGVFSDLVELIKSGVVSLDKVKFFIGYSGWAPGQLENEISRNFWVIANTNSKEIFENTTDFWKRKLMGLGPRYKLWTIYPVDPQNN